MDTFAETAIVDHRLSFADQGKQTSVFRIHGERKTEAQAIFLSPFAHRAKGSLSFVRLLTKKQRKCSGSKRTKQPCTSMLLQYDRDVTRGNVFLNSVVCYKQRHSLFESLFR